jgi:hypothetical protein
LSNFEAEDEIVKLRHFYQCLNEFLSRDDFRDVFYSENFIEVFFCQQKVKQYRFLCTVKLLGPSGVADEKVLLLQKK